MTHANTVNSISFIQSLEGSDPSNYADLQVIRPSQILCELKTIVPTFRALMARSSPQSLQA